MAFSFKESPFESLDAELRGYAESKFERRRLRKGEHFCRKGDPHRGLYWIRSGIILMYSMKEDGAYEAAGPWYSGMCGTASVQSGYHIIDNMAAVDTDIDLLPPSATGELRKFPDVAELFARWAIEDFQFVLEAGAEMSSPRVDDKIMAYFRHIMLMAQMAHTADPKTIYGEIDWPFSISKLAAFLNLSRPHVSKVVSQLTREGKIKIENRRLTIYPNGE